MELFILLRYAAGDGDEKQEIEWKNSDEDA